MSESIISDTTTDPDTGDKVQRTERHIDTTPAHEQEDVFTIVEATSDSKLRLVRHDYVGYNVYGYCSSPHSSTSLRHVYEVWITMGEERHVIPCQDMHQAVTKYLSIKSNFY